MRVFLRSIIAFVFENSLPFRTVFEIQDRPEQRSEEAREIQQYIHAVNVCSNTGKCILKIR
jgi:hypothetical protein